MGNAKLRDDDTTESYLDELAPGTELLQGQYKIDKFLNSGGFGITYLASDSLQRKVVIKECFPSSFCNRSRSIVQARSEAHTKELRSVVRLFVQEARSLAKLNHPNIVGVHQVFEDNDTAYMVLDFVEGRDLLDTLEDENHGLSAPQIKGILKDVLSAVQFIHDQDILHRDISPDNILLDADLRPVLIDFGAAREEATKKSRVLSAMRVVKDGYSPQEFYIQGSDQTPSSDLYALGATFFHLIDGEIPPNSQARLAAIASGEADPYQPMAGRIKGYDTKFLAAIDKALGILPKDRVQSAEDWLDLMEGGRRKSRVLTQQVPVSSAVAEAAIYEKKSRLVPLLGSVAAVALLALGGLTFTGKIDILGQLSQTSTAASTVAPVAPVVQAPATQTAPDVAEVAAPAAAAPTAPAVETPTQQTAVAAVPAPTPQAPAPVVEDTVDVAAVDAPASLPDPDVVETPAPVEVAKEVAPAIPGPIVDTPDYVIYAEVGPVADAPDALAPVDVSTGIDAPVAPAQSATAIDQGAKITPDAVVAIDPSATLPALDPLDEESRLAALEQIKPEPQVVEAPTPVIDLSPAQDNTLVAEAQGDASLVISKLRVGLPFEASTEGNVISAPAIVAPVWVRAGTRVLAVNGVEIDSLSEIDAVVAYIAASTDVESIELAFTVQADGETATTEHSWVVPLQYETSLPNGTVFQTSHVDGKWQTVVTQVNGTGSELRVGDQVVAFVATSETLSDRQSLRDILERELANGTQKFNFAVSRNGSMWVVSMTYAEGA